ncbi:hypothetical protein QR98_0102890 [Sarcoptes scabiei]|uniref:Uncharacterized protein n=1 Tax=Sarcoptes scabiei TaxID=52283 RepID=A0A132AM96_SARSC|nr:hypothetical protein QR98_0102890 [Sarcoptes scabiei]
MPNRPWYYVPGNNQLSEKRLVLKLDREANKQIQNEKLMDYYNKCKSEAKLSSNWEQKRRLVKSNRESRIKDSIGLSAVPFHIDDPNQLEIDRKNYENNLKLFRTQLSDYEIISRRYKNDYIDASLAIDYLLKQVEIYDEIKQRRKKFLLDWSKNFKSEIYNYVNDPLRQMCFSIRTMLEFYKSIVAANVERMKRFNSMQKFFNRSESEDLDELNQRCLQIIELYISLNEIRDQHFQNIEERDSHWLEQRKIWSQEITIWDEVFVELFDSNYHLVRKRIDEILCEQRSSLKERLKRLRNLECSIDRFNADENLRSILFLGLD